MTVVKWTDDLDTGFHDIDRQHQQLVEHINAFYEACGNNNRERMSIVLFDLISSASSHFEYEEGLMEQAGYPLLAPHRRVHQNFITKLMSLHEKLHEGENVADEVLHSLDGWLFRHIKINDKGYIDSINKADIYHDHAEHAHMLAQQLQEYGEPEAPKAETQTPEEDSEEPRGWANGLWKL